MSGYDLTPGQMVGEYRIERKIGEGGFGKVYAAVHPVIGKAAAVKILNPELASKPEMVTRFVDEARAVNQIRHRNIIDIFSFGTLPDGLHYFVMELLEGMSLDDYLEKNAPLEPGHALAILWPVGRALVAAHKAGVAHRDLKPENVFLTFDEEGVIFPKLLDFGIAKLLHESELAHRTRTGVMMGTPLYMSPEQCRGSGVDHRSDIYSFGIMTHEVLTGGKPFTADTMMDLIMKQLSEPPPSMSSRRPDLPRSLDAAVLHMLEKQVDRRPPTMQAALEELLAAARAGGVQIPQSILAASRSSQVERAGSAAPVAPRPAAGAAAAPDTGAWLQEQNGIPTTPVRRGARAEAAAAPTTPATPAAPVASVAVAKAATPAAPVASVAVAKAATPAAPVASVAVAKAVTPAASVAVVKAATPATTPSPGPGASQGSYSRHGAFLAPGQGALPSTRDVRQSLPHEGAYPPHGGGYPQDPRGSHPPDQRGSYPGPAAGAGYPHTGGAAMSPAAGYGPQYGPQPGAPVRRPASAVGVLAAIGGGLFFLFVVTVIGLVVAFGSDSGLHVGVVAPSPGTSIERDTSSDLQMRLTAAGEAQPRMTIQTLRRARQKITIRASDGERVTRAEIQYGEHSETTRVNGATGSTRTLVPANRVLLATVEPNDIAVTSLDGQPVTDQEAEQTLEHTNLLFHPPTDTFREPLAVGQTLRPTPDAILDLLSFDDPGPDWTVRVEAATLKVMAVDAAGQRATLRVNVTYVMDRVSAPAHLATTLQGTVTLDGRSGLFLNGTLEGPLQGSLADSGVPFAVAGSMKIDTR